MLTFLFKNTSCLKRQGLENQYLALGYLPKEWSEPISLSSKIDLIWRLTCWFYTFMRETNPGSQTEESLSFTPYANAIAYLFRALYLVLATLGFSSSSSTELRMRKVWYFAFFFAYFSKYSSGNIQYSRGSSSAVALSIYAFILLAWTPSWIGRAA